MWIARNKTGELFLYSVKPIRLISNWCSDDKLPDFAKYEYDENFDICDKEEQDDILGMMELDKDDAGVVDEYTCRLDRRLFPDLKWKDEPIEVEFNIIATSIDHLSETS